MKKGKRIKRLERDVKILEDRINALYPPTVPGQEPKTRSEENDHAIRSS